MCFERIWETKHLLRISPNSINRLVFMTESDRVYCAVRAEFLCIIQKMLGFETFVFRPLISAHCILFCFV